jgi:Trypsin-like peptidase domain
MPSDALSRWTLEELVAELKARPRKRRGRAPGLALGAPDLGGPPIESLDAVPTPSLVGAVIDLQRAVYGTDDRQDLYQVQDAGVLAAADSVAALVRSSNLVRNRRGAYVLETTSYREDYSLCKREPFASQPLGCFCSGFLVAPDVVATAGHCVSSTHTAKRIRFVFGFRMLDERRARTTFDASDVYAGAELIARRFSEGGQDWALVRLDRAVAGRRPLSIRTTGKIDNGEPLHVIGHPNGLPAKYAPGARVRDNRPQTFFVANLDTYGGNSGSPVFSATSGRVEGILVRGENDFVETSEGCQVSLVCPDNGCGGEDVTRTTVFANRIR